MIVMPLRIGRPRSLSPQPHNRQDFQHAPHPPDHHRDHPPSHRRHNGSNRDRGAGDTMNSYVSGVGVNASSVDPAVVRLRSREDSVLEVAAVKNRQLALRLGEIDRESQRLLKLRQREAAEVRKMKKEIQKHSVYDNSSMPGKGNTDKFDHLADVLSHSQINLNLPRVSSRQNSPIQSPARTRKSKSAKKPSELGSPSEQIKVVVKDYSNVSKSFEPQRTSSDSDLRGNDSLLSPGTRKRSMSASSLFPKESLSRDFHPAEQTTRSATSSPHHTPTIHIEPCGDDLASRAHTHESNEDVNSNCKTLSTEEDDDNGGITRRAKPVWELGLSPVRRARSPNELRKSQGICFTSTPFCKQHHHHHSLEHEETHLRHSRSEGNLDSSGGNSMSDPRFQRLTSILVPNDRSSSPDPISSSDLEESHPEAEKPALSTFLQLPTLRVPDGFYDENPVGLVEHTKEVNRARSPPPERRPCSPSKPSQVPQLPEVRAQASPMASPKASPRRVPSSPRRHTTGSKTDHVSSGGRRGVSVVSKSFPPSETTYLSPGQIDIASPPLTPI